MTHILIIEDEDRIASFVEKGLRAAGYATMRAATAAAGFENALNAAVDLVVLDLGLPDEDGLGMLSRLRAKKFSAPVVILTARDTPADTVAGLDSGADDYMAKPFSIDELLARIRLRLRGGSAEEPTRLSSGPLELDLRSRTISVDGVQHELPPGSSPWQRPFCATPARCSPVSSCWRWCGATASTRGPIWWTSMSGTCGQRWALRP